MGNAQHQYEYGHQGQIAVNPLQTQKIRQSHEQTQHIDQCQHQHWRQHDLSLNSTHLEVTVHGSNQLFLVVFQRFNPIERKEAHDIVQFVEHEISHVGRGIEGFYVLRVPK